MGGLGLGLKCVRQGRAHKAISSFCWIRTYVFKVGPGLLSKSPVPECRCDLIHFHSNHRISCWNDALPRILTFINHSEFGLTITMQGVMWTSKYPVPSSTRPYQHQPPTVCISGLGQSLANLQSTRPASCNPSQ